MCATDTNPTGGGEADPDPPFAPPLGRRLQFMHGFGARAFSRPVHGPSPWYSRHPSCSRTLRTLKHSQPPSGVPHHHAFQSSQPTWLRLPDRIGFLSTMLSTTCRIRLASCAPKQLLQVCYRDVAVCQSVKSAWETRNLLEPHFRPLEEFPRLEPLYMFPKRWVLVTFSK